MDGQEWLGHEVTRILSSANRADVTLSLMRRYGLGWPERFNEDGSMASWYGEERLQSWLARFGLQMFWPRSGEDRVIFMKPT